MARVRPALVRRYAEALYDVLDSAEERERAARLMNSVAAAWRAERDVRVVLGAPSMSIERRVALVGTLAGGELGPALTNLATMVLERRREGVLASLGSALEKVMDERKGLVRVTVTTAAPLDDEARKRVHALADKLADGPTEVQEVVDTGVIGGLQLRVGDRLIDASLRGYLDQIVEQVEAAPMIPAPPAKG